jgi:hypothetical protein
MGRRATARRAQDCLCHRSGNGKVEFFSRHEAQSVAVECTRWRRLALAIRVRACSSSSHINAGRMARILLIDDMDLVRGLFRTILQ